MKSEHKANESLAHAVEAFQAEQERFRKVLEASPKRVARPAVKPVKASLFNRLFSFN